ncbi:MAG: helix-turn-helix transcriptional regulator [Mesorhizobium sp.]
MPIACLIHVLPLEQRRGINRREAADIWGVSPTFFDRLVREGQAPQPRRLHGRQIWHRHEVEEAFDRWFEHSPSERGAQPTADNDDLDAELTAFEARHGYR